MSAARRNGKVALEDNVEPAPLPDVAATAPPSNDAGSHAQDDGDAGPGNVEKPPVLSRWQKGAETRKRNRLAAQAQGDVSDATTSDTNPKARGRAKRVPKPRGFSGAGALSLPDADSTGRGQVRMSVVQHNANILMEGPLPEPPADRMQPGRKRARARNARTSQATEKAQMDEWTVLQGKLDDVLSGRADRRLDEWEKGWRDSCDRLEEQKSFKMDEKALLKDIGALLKRCSHLEHKLGIRD